MICDLATFSSPQLTLCLYFKMVDIAAKLFTLYDMLVYIISKLLILNIFNLCKLAIHNVNISAGEKIF